MHEYSRDQRGEQRCMNMLLRTPILGLWEPIFPGMVEMPLQREIL